MSCCLVDVDKTTPAFCGAELRLPLCLSLAKMHLARLVVLAAVALAAAEQFAEVDSLRKPSRKPSHSPTPSRTPKPKPSHSSMPSPTPLPSGPSENEIWSAFFVLNGTVPTPPDTAVATFRVARWNPQSAYDYFISQPFSWPLQTPMYAKSLGPSKAMAVDSVARRGWAIFGTTDWSQHTWVMDLSFPRSNFNSTVFNGVCELLNYTNVYAINQPYYHMRVGRSGANPRATGPWFAYYGGGYPFVTNIMSVTVPAWNPKSGGTIPPCVVSNVSTISDPAFQPNKLPAFSVGSDQNGDPVILQADTSTTNTSQMNITAWSVLSGQRVYAQTFACGYPSYLFACPATTGADWPMAGLFTLSLANGTLLVGGGPWSSQQYFQAVLPIPGSSGSAGSIPVLTPLNITSNQGTWLSNNPGGSALWAPCRNCGKGKPGSWPVYSQNIQGSAPCTACAANQYSQLQVLTILGADGTAVNNSYVGGSVSPSCPLRSQDIPGWINTAVCMGSSVGLPDLLWQ